MQLNIVSLFAAVLFGTLATAAARGDRGDFSLTCTDVSLDSTDLKAACYTGRTEDRAPHPNNLDLNLCIGLNQSTNQLEWAY